MEDNKTITLFIQFQKQKNEIGISFQHIQIQKKAIIVFNTNEIEIGNESIQNINERIEEDKDLQVIQLFDIKENEKKEIYYNNKTYQLSQAELFALFLSPIIFEIEKNWIIENIELDDEINESLERNSLLKALQLLNFSNVIINKTKLILEELEEKEFEQISEIVKWNDDYLKYKHQIERMKTIIKDTENNEIKEKILQINPNDSFNKSSEIKEITSQLSTKEKTKYKLYKLNNNYCIFLASRWFESIDDFINLEKVSKRMRGNMEKFHYNPIPLTSSIRSFFPNIETLYIYDIDNCELFENDEKIKKRYCVQTVTDISLHKIEEKTKEMISFQTIQLSHCKELKNYESIVNEFGPFSFKYSGKYSLVIPTNITRIGNNCFQFSQRLTSISFPSTISYLEKQTCYKCPNLTEIKLPNSLISIGEKCFCCCEKLESITIPSSVEYIGRKAFSGCRSLTSITIGNQWKLHGNRLFNNWNGLLVGVDIPSTIKEINGKEIEIKPLEEYEISNGIIQISDHCFEDCLSLKRVHIPSSVKRIGKDSFKFCTSLETEHSLLKKEEIKSKPLITEEEMKQIEEWTKSLFKEILFDTDYCDWSSEKSSFNKRIEGKENIIIIIEDINNNVFGGYVHKTIENDANLENTTIVRTYLKDFNIFVFSIKSNGRERIPKKFERQEIDKPVQFVIFEDNYHQLFTFGKK